MIKSNKNFYSYPNKITQDTLILKYTKGTSSKPNKSGTMNEVRNLAINYYIPKMCSKTLIPVCRDLFLSTLLLSKKSCTRCRYADILIWELVQLEKEVVIEKLIILMIKKIE